MDQSLLQPTTEKNRLNDEEQDTDAATDAFKEYREITVDEPLRPARLRFDPPLEFDGQKYHEVIFDFESLIGKDFQRAEREFTHRYKPEKGEVVIPEMKQLYRVILAAHTANVPVGLIDKLPGRYYVQVLTEVLKLYGGSLEEEKA